MRMRAITYAIIFLSIFIVLALLVTVLKPDMLRQWVNGIELSLIERKTYGRSVEAEVKRVVDGDTIVLSNGETVRLLNIDTPETVKQNTPIMCYGPEASAFNKQLESKKQVILTFDKDQRDRYGRLLAFVFEKGSDTTIIDNSYNAQLVKLGYARSYILRPNDTYERYFRKLEREAREQKLGAWSVCPKPFVE